MLTAPLCKPSNIRRAQCSAVQTCQAWHCTQIELLIIDELAMKAGRQNGNRASKANRMALHRSSLCNIRLHPSGNALMHSITSVKVDAGVGGLAALRCLHP